MENLKPQRSPRDEALNSNKRLRLAEDAQAEDFEGEAAEEGWVEILIACSDLFHSLSLSLCYIDISCHTCVTKKHRKKGLHIAICLQNASAFHSTPYFWASIGLTTTL